MIRALPSIALGGLAVLLAACGTPPPTGDLTGEASVTLDPATQQARWRTPGYVPASSGVSGEGIHTIRFAAVVGDAPFRCGASYGGIGVTGSTILPTDFRFFVSEVALIDEAGRQVPMNLAQDGRWQHQNVALLDFEDGQGPCAGGTPDLRQSVTGAVPYGRYRGIAFTLGVPAPLNVGAPALPASPLNDPNLAWPAPGGFRFLKLDMATSGQPLGSYGVVPSTVPAPLPAYPGTFAYPVIPAYPTVTGPVGALPYGFPVHIGGAECTGYGPGPYTPPGCGFPTRLRVTLPEFDTDRNVVVADLRALLVTSNVDVNTPGTPAGCQSTYGDPDCAGVAAMLGLAMPGGYTPPQSVFRVGVQP
ncbi:MbnP family copper-binding protein [Stella sp.]|uniref:MbnP family copper-binding protein n=1 Tax=Stella sp. TaxID=2912054 RepID=UPI0035AF8615